MTHTAEAEGGVALCGAWVRVNSWALARNLQAVRDVITAHSPGCKLCAVVKADGYGHGAAAAARTFVDAGAHYLAVTTIDEALELAANGIDPARTPVLAFAPASNPEQLAVAVRFGLHITVCDREQAHAVAAASRQHGSPANVHVKVDTGMGRLGLTADGAVDVAAHVFASRDLRLAGVYTHFARAAEPSSRPTPARCQSGQATESALASRPHWPPRR